MELLGLDTKLQEFKSTIEDASELSGKSLREFEENLNRTLNPSVYTDSLKYDLERAQKRRPDIEAACGCAPSMDPD